jgi:hypothetical protein
LLSHVVRGRRGQPERLAGPGFSWGLDLGLRRSKYIIGRSSFDEPSVTSCP